MDLAEKLLNTYPDYSKAPDGYLVAISRALALLDEEEIELLMHPRNGLISECKFLPTVADISKFLKDREPKHFELPPSMVGNSGYTRFERRYHDAPIRKPFRPFPKLWEAFADDPEAMKALDSHLPFETLDGAARALATRSKQAARDYLTI